MPRNNEARKVLVSHGSFGDMATVRRWVQVNGDFKNTTPTINTA